MGLEQVDSAPPPDLKIEIFRSIEEIDQGVWDDANTGQSIASSWGLLRALEQSGTEAALYWYIVLRRGMRVVATAVLSEFSVRLDLLIDARLQRIADVVRRVIPRFLKVRILFCGLPLSVGKSALAIVDPADTDRVLESIEELMTSIARQKKLKLLCFKEFRGSEQQGLSTLKRLGFVKASSIPTVMLPIEWPSEESYLSSLRHGYRRQVLSSRRKLEAAHATVVEQPVNRESIGRLAGLYNQVIARVPFRLEALTASFFTELAVRLPDRLAILEIRHQHNVVAAALLGKDRSTLRFLFVGLDYDKFRGTDAYFNLLYAIIRYAINNNYRVVDLGQTSYWPKLRLGGQCDEMHFYLRSERRWTHKALTILEPFLFPRHSLPNPRVFIDRSADAPGRHNMTQLSTALRSES